MNPRSTGRHTSFYDDRRQENNTQKVPECRSAKEEALNSHHLAAHQSHGVSSEFQLLTSGADEIAQNLPPPLVSSDSTKKVSCLANQTGKTYGAFGGPQRQIWTGEMGLTKGIYHQKSVGNGSPFQAKSP